MALISPSRQLRILGVLILILLFSLVAPHKQQSQLNLMSINKIKPERNATIALFPVSNVCSCAREHTSYNKYLLNEVCLSSLFPHNDFRFLEMPKCVVRGREPGLYSSHTQMKLYRSRCGPTFAPSRATMGSHRVPLPSPPL